MENLLAHVRFKNLFAQADGGRCDLDQLIIADILEGIFEGHLTHRREVESIVGTDGVGVGELW